MKRLMLLWLVSSWAVAGPIYSCNVGGKTVFQQNPCTADKLESLAPTYTSEVYKREEIERQQKAAADAQRAREWEQARAEKARSDWEKSIAEGKEKKSNARAQVLLLKECVTNSTKCEVEPLRIFSLGLTQDGIESAFGQGRQQHIGDRIFYYYNVPTTTGIYKFQVTYQYQDIPTENGSSLAYVATEINY